MFDSKLTNLFTENEKTGNKKTSVMSTDNKFLKAALKETNSTTELGNGAKKYTTTGSDFVDQFANATNYRNPRNYSDVSTDMSVLWEQNPKMALSLTFYLRMITRQVQYADGSKSSVVQRGQGLKHEGIFRMMWVAINHPDVFWDNIPLFISIGSWKDIILMLSYDLQYNGWKNRALDWNKFSHLIMAGLENPNTSELLKKYLPQIKANNKCKTVESQADNMIAKWICSFLFDGEKISNYRKYRLLKSSGTAHEWQKLISQRKMFNINFDTIHGRALAQLVSSKFLAKNGLETKYEEWIKSKPVAKYTGYVYELLAPVQSGYRPNELKSYQEYTINKQFYGMIEQAEKDMDTNSSLLVVVDTSSSMTSKVPGTNTTSYNVAKSMALYFSYLLKGKFNKAWMEFNDNATLKFWKGETPVECLQNDRSEAYGSTNFMSVANVFYDLKMQGVPENEFPTGILCVSDGCFDSLSSNRTNFNEFIAFLRKAGFSKEYVDNFKVILWDIPNYFYGCKPQTAFEDFADTPNLYHISGLDGSVVAFINGDGKEKKTPKTSEELFLSAMNQESLNKLVI